MKCQVGQPHLADNFNAQVNNEKVAGRIKRDALRMADVGAEGWDVIPQSARCVPGHRRKQARGKVNLGSRRW